MTQSSIQRSKTFRGTIRRLELGDLDAARYLLDYWLNLGAPHRYDQEIAVYLERMVASTRPGAPFYYFVAEEERRVVGIFGYAPVSVELRPLAATAQAAQLWNFYVHPEDIRRGIGHVFCAFMEGEAARRYQELLLMSSARFRVTAWGFYEREGYRLIHEYNREDGLLCRVYQKLLANGPAQVSGARGQAPGAA
jgi:GNAT superfamily N-acetyltransferase